MNKDVQSIIQSLLSNPFVLAFPPGHYHSPLPTPREIARSRRTLPEDPPAEIPGIDFDSDTQFDLLRELSPYFHDHCFTAAKQNKLRYYFNQPYFGKCDALILHAMLRHFKPARVIEAGSGLSSCVMLDTRDYYLDYEPRLTFIDPNPERLLENMDKLDATRCATRREKLQDAPIGLFSQLGESDILFYDGSHVAKRGSDVNHFFFEILPRLEPGVIVHVHDIFYPFDYPMSWYERGFAWNETFIARAFLQFNDSFKTLMFAPYLAATAPEAFSRLGPPDIADTGGSLWLRKVK